MYDFLYSEVWWMEGIVIALITTAGVLGGAFIAYGGKLNDVFKHLSDLTRDHGDLSKEHDNLSKDHEKLLNKNDELSKNNTLILNATGNIASNISETKSTVTKMHEEALLEKGRQEALFSSLSSSGKELNEFISTGINSIKALQQEYMKLSEKSNTQYQEVSRLKEEISKLRDKIEELQEENNALNNENDKLIDDYNLLVAKNLKLIDILNNRTEPTHEFSNDMGYDR